MNACNRGERSRGRLALLTLLVLSSAAYAGEPRRFGITPGLVFDAEVVESENDGIRVRVAQGTLFIPFDILEDMQNLGSLDEVGITEWTVLLVGDGPARELASATFSAMPHVSVRSIDELDDPELRARASSCGESLSCLAALRSAGEWQFLAHAELDGAAVQIDGIPPWRRAASTWTVVPGEPLGMWQAAQAALGLEPDDQVPASYVEAFPDLLKLLRGRPEPHTPPPVDPPPDLPDIPPTVKPEKTWTSAKVAAWSFVPVPGLPSLLQKDYGAFGGALASTAALTAGWVGATGAATTRRAEHIALASVGSYVGCIASSQLFGALGLKKQRAAVSVLPTIGDGQVDGVMLGVQVYDGR